MPVAFFVSAEGGKVDNRLFSGKAKNNSAFSKSSILFSYSAQCTPPPPSHLLQKKEKIHPEKYFNIKKKKKLKVAWCDEYDLSVLFP